MSHYIRILILLSLLPISILAQEKVILTGNIKNANNEPIPFANIGIVNTNIGTATNINGYFEFSFPYRDTVIIGISTVGYERFYDTLIKPQKRSLETIL